MKLEVSRIGQWPELWSVLCLCLTLSRGSEVKFQSYPDNIKVGLTTDLSLRCSLQDTPTNNPIIIGRRDVTKLVENVKSVTSLAVKLDGNLVATVKNNDPAKLHVNWSNTTVTGGTSGAAFLQVKVTDPAEGHLGEFVCEVLVVLDVSDDNVVLSSTLEVEAADPTTADIVQEIRALRQNNLHLQAEVSKIPGLEAELVEMGHVEQGSIQCGNTQTWSGRAGPHDNIRYTDKSQKFKRSYLRNPLVFLSVNYLAKFEDQPLTFAVTLRNVSLDSFVLTCQTHNGYMITGMAVDWVSVPQS